MTRIKYALISALTAGSGCNPTLGTITSEEHSSSASSTTATASTSGDTASTESADPTRSPTEAPAGTSSTTSVDTSTSGSTMGQPAGSTDAGGSSTGEMMDPIYRDCPVCTESYQACVADPECKLILESGCAEGDLMCMAQVLKDHCAGKKLFRAFNFCLQENCTLPECTDESQACEAAAGCAELRACMDACAGCGDEESCQAACKAQTNVADSNLYNAWVECVLNA